MRSRSDVANCSGSRMYGCAEVSACTAERTETRCSPPRLSIR